MGQSFSSCDCCPIHFRSLSRKKMAIVVALISEFPITQQSMGQNNSKIWTVTVLEKWIDGNTMTILLPANSRDLSHCVRNNVEADSDHWVSYYCKIISPTYDDYAVALSMEKLSSDKGYDLFEYETCQKENRRYTRGRRPTTFDPSPKSPACPSIVPATPRTGDAPNHVPLPAPSQRVVDSADTTPTSSTTHLLPPGLSPQIVMTSTFQQTPTTHLALNHHDQGVESNNSTPNLPSGHLIPTGHFPQNMTTGAEQYTYNPQYPSSMMPPYYQPPQQQFAAGYNQTNVWGTPAMSFSALPLPIWDRRPPSDSSSLQPAGTWNINPPGGAANHPEGEAWNVQSNNLTTLMPPPTYTESNATSSHSDSGVSSNHLRSFENTLSSPSTSTQEDGRHSSSSSNVDSSLSSTPTTLPSSRSSSLLDTSGGSASICSTSSPLDTTTERQANRGSRKEAQRDKLIETLVSLSDVVKKTRDEQKTLVASITDIQHRQLEVADREAARQIIGHLPKRTPEEFTNLNSTLETATPPVKAYFMSEIKSVGGVRDMKDWTKNAWNKVAIPLVLAGLNWAGTERIDRDKKKGVSQFAITGMIFEALREVPLAHQNGYTYEDFKSYTCSTLKQMPRAAKCKTNVRRYGLPPALPPRNNVAAPHLADAGAPANPAGDQGGARNRPADGNGPGALPTATGDDHPLPPRPANDQEGAAQN